MKMMKRLLVLCLVVAMCIGTALPAKALSTTQAESFLTQLYTGLLGRSPDDAGKALYSNKMINDGVKGAVIAEYIAGSAEFRAQELSNEEFVNRMYRGLLGREPDAGGKATYLGYLGNGYSRTWVFKQIVASLEFATKCISFGVIAGDASASTSTPSMTQTAVSSGKAAAFVQRLYKYLLGRDGTAAERQGWVDKLTGRTMSAAGVAAAIASSTEFNKRSLTNGDFLKYVYLALLGRDADETGWVTYQSHLANGKSRSWVFSNICASAEFKKIATEMNAAAGTVSTGTPIAATNVNAAKAGEFVARAYTNYLGRSATDDEKAYWVKVLTNRKMSAAGVAAEIASSKEARNRDITREAFVNATYQVLLGRAPDPTGKETYVNALIKGYTRAWVFTKICASTEFQKRNEFVEMNVVPGYLNSASYNM